MFMTLRISVCVCVSVYVCRCVYVSVCLCVFPYLSVCCVSNRLCYNVLKVLHC